MHSPASTISTHSLDKAQIELKIFDGSTASNNFLLRPTLNMYYQNARGINSKASDIFFNSSLFTDCDLIVLTETWLHSDANSYEFFNACNFNVIRNDRNFLETSKNSGGGVLIAAHKSVYYVEIKPESIGVDLSNLKSVDILIIKLKVRYQSIYVVVLYIPPSTSVNDYILLFDSLISVDIFFESKLIILGDFNVPEFFSSQNSSKNSTNVVHACKDFMNFFGLTQNNDITNPDNRLLDLVFSNLDCKISRAVELLTHEDYYHPAINISIQTHKTRSTSFRSNNSKEFNFRKANFPLLYMHLYNADFSVIESTNEVNEALEFLYDILFNIFRSCIPLKKSAVGNYPKWYNKAIICILRRKHKAWVKYKKHKCAESLDIFRSLRTQAKRLLKDSYRSYMNRAVADIKADPKKFWTFIKEKNKQVDIPSLMIYEGKEVDNPQDIVNAFCHYFKKSFVFDSDQYTSVVDMSVNNLLDIKLIDEKTVFNAIKKLKSSMTAGTDTIPSFLIRDCASVLSNPLKVIFNLILRTSVFPDLWKNSRVVPVYKAGQRNEISNYRPITLINNFAKVFEYVLHSQMYAHIATYLSPQQHGFIKGKSTVTNLFLKTQYLADCIDRRSQVDCVYTDFSKAFDRINHRILLNKMETFGFSNSLIQLFRSYLSHRYQYVWYKGHSSASFTQNSGVPQGSVLGPLFFNIYINDIVDQLDVQCLLYADDLKIFHEIKSMEDCLVLQRNIDLVHIWSKKNLLPLNKCKCVIKSYSKKVKPIEFKYNLDGVVLERPEFVKDLGVTYDSKLNFIEHIAKVRASANKGLGFVIRNSREIRDFNVMQLLYSAYVRSRLEYCSVIWNPIYQVHVEDIERVQRRWLKCLVFRIDGEYPCRGTPNDILNQRFKMRSLESRRKCAYGILLYNIVNFIIKSENILELIGLNVPKKNLRNKITFHQSIPRSNAAKASPLYQMLEFHKDIERSLDIFDCRLSEIRNCSI